MKANSQLPAISADNDHRPLVLLTICLILVIIHLCQFPPNATPPASQTQVRFSWLQNQPQGSGLYRLPLTTETTGETLSQNLPNRLRPLFFQPVSVNKADQQLLSNLPGIGPILADRIVSRRKSRGDFKSPHDLLLVNGIGVGKLNKIRSLLVFD